MFIQKLGHGILPHLAVVLTWIIFATMRPTNLPGAEPSAARPEPASATVSTSTNPPVRQIGPGLFQIGEVKFDRVHRRIYFPATVNLLGGNIEYVVVNAAGKTHESLLRTHVQPLHLQLAFLLLGAKGAGTNMFSADPFDELPGEKVFVELSWVAAGKTNRAPAEDFVQDVKGGTPANRGPWIYTGSRLREDGFAAQLDGSIVSLITDPDALVNSPRRRRDDDDNWLVRTNGLPPLQSPIEVSIRLGK